MNRGANSCAKPKVISYGDSYVPIPGIIVHSRRKAFKAFLAIISITAILALFKLSLVSKTEGSHSTTKKKLRHLNPCRHLTPEPEIILQEKFDSDDYFFPYSYKERICAAPNKTETEETDSENLQRCFTEKHYCVTRYKRFDAVRIPFPGNLTNKYWKVERIYIGVACECTRTEIVKMYGT